MQKRKTITVKMAISLGIGSMVGAGIFALMGEAAALAGSAVWFSFLMAGVIALLTGHSFVELGVRYPTRGGIVEYLVRAYGVGIFSGGCSILYYIAQLIGMTMIAMAFGKFATQLIGIDKDLVLWDQVFASGLILVLVFLTLTGSTLISKMQKLFVMLNLVILTGFALLLALIMINFMSLTTVASLGGATTLMVYSLVNFGALRLLKDKGLHRTLIILAAAACTMAIVIWAVYTFKRSPHSLSIFVFFLAISFVAEWLLQKIKGRKIRVDAETPGSESVSG